MVSHVPFFDLNTVMKDKRMTMKSVHFMCTHVLYALQASCPNTFQNSCQHSTTELGQKGYLSVIFRMLFKKMFFFFLYYRTIWYTSQKEEHYFIVLVTRLLPNTHCGDSYVCVYMYIANQMPPRGSSL